MRYYLSPGVDYLPSQLEAVVAEVRRLEETAARNQQELDVLAGDQDNKGIR